MRDLRQDPARKPPWCVFIVSERNFPTLRRDRARAGYMQVKTRFLRIAQVGKFVCKSEKLPGN